MFVIHSALHCFQVCSRFPINVKTGYGLVSKRYRQVAHEAKGRPSVDELRNHIVETFAAGRDRYRGDYFGKQAWAVSASVGAPKKVVTNANV